MTRALPNYALVDAARARDVYATLQRLPSALRASLYEEISLDAYAPWLVALKPAARETVEALWGRQCVVLVWSDATIAQLRKHFRKFLTIEAGGELIYFRFYDPRVLGVFLPTCTREEREAFSGPVLGFVVEDAEGRARVFDIEPGGVLRAQSA